MTPISRKNNINTPPHIIKIGSICPSGHNAGDVVDPKGISPTVMLNHGWPVIIIEYENDNPD